MQSINDLRKIICNFSGLLGTQGSARLTEKELKKWNRYQLPELFLVQSERAEAKAKLFNPTADANAAIIST